MSFLTEVSGIFEPTLVEVFDRLNREYFSGSLLRPNALAWDYRPSRNRGGQISYHEKQYKVNYIVVRGWQKDNPNMVELTMLHEMVHLSLYQRFFETDLMDFKYRVRDFVADKSGAFILECARVAREYGCSFKELSTWDDSDSPDQESVMTTNRYVQTAKAKSLLSTLSE